MSSRVLAKLIKPFSPIKAALPVSAALRHHSTQPVGNATANQDNASSKESKDSFKKSDDEYSGELVSKQFKGKNGLIENTIDHFENGKHRACFDRVVLGGHEPSHHFSAGVIQGLNAPSGRIFGIWNENAVSSLLAGTRVYPASSYSYKTIKNDNRRDFILFNYMFLNLKEMAQDPRFHDPEKVILTSDEDKELWLKELKRLVPNYESVVNKLQEAALHFNAIGQILETKYPERLAIPNMVINGTSSQDNKVLANTGLFRWLPSSSDDRALQNNFLLKEGKESALVQYDRAKSLSKEVGTQGILNWEFNSQGIHSKNVDFSDLSDGILKASRQARKELRGFHVNEVFANMKNPPPVNANQIEKMVVEKYPHEKGGLNPTQVLRQSIAYSLMEAIDPEADLGESGEFRIQYKTSKDTYDELRANPDISKHIERLNELYKDLPLWIRRSTSYWENPA